MSGAALRFQVDLPTDRSVDLPVEVRRPDFSLVARALASQRLPIEPGLYIVTARLPGGHELTALAPLAAGEERVVHLAPDEQTDAEAASAYDWRGRAQGVQVNLTDISFGQNLPALGGIADQGKLRLLLGDPLAASPTPAPPELWTLELTPDESEGRIQWEVAGSDHFHLAQLVQPGQPALNVALPSWPQGGCLLNLTRLPAGHYTLDVQLLNEEADLLLRYRERGLLKQAALLSASSELTAERLLLHKMRDPLAATVGAYALLRLGELERLHHWTKNLNEWFPMIPDGLVLRAEHVARLGEHAAALALLLELPQRGLPFFGEGLAYAVDRLRLYSQIGERLAGTEGVAGAKALLARLQPFASHADFNKAALSFTGLDAAAPDARPHDLAAVEQLDGLDIPTLLT